MSEASINSESPETVWPDTFWNGRGWVHRLTVTATGAVAAFGFAPFHIWGLTLIALGLLFIRLVGVSNWERPVRAAFGTGLLFGLGWFSASCFWIASAFIERGPSFIPMIPPLVGGLAVLLALFWGAAGAATIWAAHKGSRRGEKLSLTRTATAFVASFMIAELLRGHILSGFPWNLAAYAFEPGGAISQSAYWLGVYGLTMLMLLVAALLGSAVLSRRLVPAGVALALVAGLFGYGTWRLSNAQTGTHPGVVLRLVASPFKQSEKIDPLTSDRVIEDYFRVSLEPGLDTVTHLVWPEGVLTGLALEDERLLRIMGSLLLSETALPPVWLINSQRMEIRPDATGRAKRYYYNSSVAVSYDELGNPAIAGLNDKKKLVPFAEFIPGGEPVERLGAQLVSTALASFTPAPEKRVSRFPGLPPVSPQICYEAVFPGLTPSADPATGQPAPAFILNQSNDAWFGKTVGPAQHAAIARYRAIEEGLPMVRSAANGISAVFDSYGRAERVLDGTRASHIDELLPLPVGEKFTMSIINALLALFSLVIYLLAGLGFRRA